MRKQASGYQGSPRFELHWETTPIHPKKERARISLPSQPQLIFLVISRPYEINEWHLPDGHCGPKGRTPNRPKRSRC